MHEANIYGLITKFYFIDIRCYSFSIELFFLSVTHLKVVTVPSAFVQDTPLRFVSLSKYFRLSFARKASLKSVVAKNSIFCLFVRSGPFCLFSSFIFHHPFFSSFFSSVPFSSLSDKETSYVHTSLSAISSAAPSTFTSHSPPTRLTALVKWRPLNVNRHICCRDFANKIPEKPSLLSPSTTHTATLVSEFTSPPFIQPPRQFHLRHTSVYFTRPHHNQCP